MLLNNKKQYKSFICTQLRWFQILVSLCNWPSTTNFYLSNIDISVQLTLNYQLLPFKYWYLCAIDPQLPTSTFQILVSLCNWPSTTNFYLSNIGISVQLTLNYQLLPFKYWYLCAIDPQLPTSTFQILVSLCNWPSTTNFYLSNIGISVQLTLNYQLLPFKYWYLCAIDPQLPTSTFQILISQCNWPSTTNFYLSNIGISVQLTLNYQLLPFKYWYLCAIDPQLPTSTTFKIK